MKCRSQILLDQRRGYYGSALAKAAAKLLNRAKAWAKNKQVVKKAAHSYLLHKPNQLTRERYVKIMRRTISKDAFLGKELVSAFVASNLYNTSKMKASRLANAVTHIAVRKILSKIITMQSSYAMTMHVIYGDIPETQPDLPPNSNRTTSG